MEKFAVDLDKVLDDFELNEDRAERLASKSRVLLPPKVTSSQQPRLRGDSLPAEASERLLRRINLLDADFAPDPAPVSVFPSDASSVAYGHPNSPPQDAHLANGESERVEEEVPSPCEDAVLLPPHVGTEDSLVAVGEMLVAQVPRGPSQESSEEPHCNEGDVSGRQEATSPCAVAVVGCAEGLVGSPGELSNGGAEEGELPSLDAVRPAVEDVLDACVPCSEVLVAEQPTDEGGGGVGGEEGSVEEEGGGGGGREELRPVSFQAEQELSDAEFVKYMAELEEEEGAGDGAEGGRGGAVEEGGSGVEGAGGGGEGAGSGVEGAKTEDASREEVWQEEGSGSALLDASSSLPTSSPPPLCMESGEEVRPQRPGTLPLVPATMPPRHPSAEDDEEDIPIPLVIGPPGATPANPRPPSDIAAQGLRGDAASADCETGDGAVVASSPTEHAKPFEAASCDGVKLEQMSQALSSSSSEEGVPLGEGRDEKDDESSSPSSSELGPTHGEGVAPVTEASSLEAVAAEEESSRLSTHRSSNTLSLGDVAPFWVPDADAPACMLCMAKFTLIKRRHHCRACGKVLCSKCCSSRARLAYMDHSEARVCAPCQSIIAQEASGAPSSDHCSHPHPGGCTVDAALHRKAASRPDPNNPMEYCSTVPPLEQVGERALAPPPSVMVPVGVLKREGSSSRPKGETKQVMFSDGIRPGGELSDLDPSSNGVTSSSKGSSGLSAVQRRIASRLAKRLVPGGVAPPGSSPTPLLPAVGSSSIPGDALPPMIVDQSTANGLVALGLGGGRSAGEYNFEDGPELDQLVETLMDESEPPVSFALSKNFFVLVKIITLDCCVNRVVWSFTTRGMRCVGQDEVVVLLEWLPSDKGPPRDIFCHLSALYEQASKGNTVTEMGHSTVQGVFLGSHNHGGFLYIRATFQCLRRLPLPPPPFLFGLLLHRMETPWAKVFPIRVMLRLGAEFRYYPCPLVGIRGREPVYHQIGHTIMNLLSDFRNFAYILPSVRGMVVHMEERQTSILLPRNRLSQVERALDDCEDHVLALAASFSSAADSHLVCVQGEAGDASTGSSQYHTQAINIQNKPRKVTGASFVVFNGALKVSSKLTAKSSIVEDGLMVQVLPDTLVTLRNALRNGEDFVIPCGPTSPVSSPPPPPAALEEGGDAAAVEPAPSTQQVGEQQPPSAPDEVVIVRWVDDDKNFNIGVKSPIDGMALDGVPSIRVHNGTNYVSDTKFIRWTEVFLIQQQQQKGEQSGHCGGAAVDVSRVSESIAHAACLALHPYLDLLWSHELTLIAVRATIGPDSEGYEAGCGGSRLPPIYMNSLDNELIGVLHRIEWRPQDCTTQHPLVLELLFHVMEL